MATALFPLQREIILSYFKNVNNYDVTSARLMRESSLMDSVEKKQLIPVLTDVTPKYLKKINDAYSTMESMDIDINLVTDFFNSITTDTFTNESIPLKDMDAVGNLKPDYLKQMVYDMRKTIDDIINKRKTMKDLMMYVSSNPAIKLKRQLVTVSNPIIDPMDYIRQQERIPLKEINSDTITRSVVPFLRSFPAIKKNLTEEVMSVKEAIQHVAVMLHKYSDTIEEIKQRGSLDAPTVDCLNYYLYNQYRIVEELISYLTFSLVVKIDNCIFNMNAYNDLYRRHQTLTGEDSVIKESAYEYSMAGIDLDNLSKRASQGDMSGVIDWTIRAYDGVLSAYNHQNSTYSTIQFILDQFTNPNFVFDTIMHQLNQIVINIDNIKPALKSAYANPTSLLKDAGLLDLDGVISEAKKISDTMFYDSRISDGNLPYSDTLFTLMAEMRQSPDKCESLGTLIKSVYDKFEEFYQYVSDSSDIPNDVVRKETKDSFSNIMGEFDVLVKELVENIISRYQKLEKLCYKLMGMQGEVVECSDEIEYNDEYNVFALESCVDLDRDTALLMIESEMKLFKELKLAKVYGLYTEAGEGSQPAETQQKTKTQSGDTQSGKTEGGSEKVGVEKDGAPTAQAAQQNQQAAEQTENTNGDNTDENNKKTEDDKGFFKNMIKRINEFFEKILDNFKRSVNSKFMKDKEFLDKYKDELLSRNCTGLKINMYNYDFQTTGTNMLADITKVNTVLGQLTDTNIQEFKEDVLRAKLFNGIALNASIQDTTTAVQMYYKIGPKETEIKKVSYETTSRIKELIAKMVEFCENFCVKQEYNQMDKELETIKKTLEDKIKAMEGKFPDDKKKEYESILTGLQKMVLVFSGAVLTGYRNRFQHYMYILRKCIVKKDDVKTPDQEENATQTNEQQGQQPQQQPTQQPDNNAT